MQILRTILALLVFYSVTVGAETTNQLTQDVAVMVTVNSSEPPATPISNSKKPSWVNDDTGGKMDAVNNMWYPLENRMDDIRIGGFGDQYEVFMRFPAPAGKTASAKLRLHATSGGKKMPNKIEIRRVTTPDPLPIVKKSGVSWEPERIRFAMRPSSEHFASITPTEGWIEIDITELVKAWSDDPKSNHGIHIVSTQHRDHWLRINGPRSEKNPPQLVIRN